MKKLLVLLALASAGMASHAQEAYVGTGLPGLLTVGYSAQIFKTISFRGEYSDGLKVSKDGNQDGLNITGDLKASRAGAFVDWYLMNNDFRLVGGMTANDIKAAFKATSGVSSVNGKQVDLTGETFNVNFNYPSVTPYFGIGYGHQGNSAKGWGVYADAGLTFGTFGTTVDTTIVGKNINGVTVTQQDVNAQTMSMRDKLSGISLLPSVSVGVSYKF